MNKSSKNIALFFIFILILLGIAIMIREKPKEDKDYSYSKFIELVKSGEVEKVVIEERNITGFLKKEITDDASKEPAVFNTYIPWDDPDLIKLLNEYNVNFSGKQKKQMNSFWRNIIGFIPLLLILLIFWIIIARQIQGPGNKAMSFGKSKAILQDNSKKKVTFKDVAGEEEAKQELEEVIDFLKEPKKFTKIGAKIPKGVLLIGPPGTGKTLLGKAIAGEADVPFFSISGSDFVEMFVGVGASRVRDLFNQGKKHAPCILFIDEIDAVGRQRGAGLGGGHDEREQTLNQLLVEMDGFETKEGVILLAATNRPDVLDPALLRPGRFDRQVVVDIPDLNGRNGILEVHTKKIPLSDDVKLDTVAKGTPGFSGADLANLVNEAALLAARRNKSIVTMAEFEEAKDKVLMGPERRSLRISKREKEITAFHEAGHALVSFVLPETDPLHKVTIIPRGRALGLTQSLPEEEKHNYSKEYWFDQVCTLLAGRIAEEITFYTLTTGAMNDIERATDISRKMVCDWGMSSLGPLSFSQQAEHVFLGRELAQHKNYSEETAKKIDSEINKIITQCNSKTNRIILKYKTKLKKLATELIKKETLTKNDIDRILRGTSQFKSLKKIN